MAHLDIRHGKVSAFQSAEAAAEHFVRINNHMILHPTINKAHPPLIRGAIGETLAGAKHDSASEVNRLLHKAFVHFQAANSHGAIPKSPLPTNKLHPRFPKLPEMQFLEHIADLVEANPKLFTDAAALERKLRGRSAGKS